MVKTGTQDWFTSQAARFAYPKFEEALKSFCVGCANYQVRNQVTEESHDQCRKPYHELLVNLLPEVLEQIIDELLSLYDLNEFDG